MWKTLPTNVQLIIASSFVLNMFHNLWIAWSIEFVANASSDLLLNFSQALSKRGIAFPSWNVFASFYFMKSCSQAILKKYSNVWKWFKCSKHFMQFSIYFFIQESTFLEFWVCSHFQYEEERETVEWLRMICTSSSKLKHIV